MRELNIQEIQFVSGAGFIKDRLTNLGSNIGDLGYSLVSSSINVNVPLLGEVSIGKVFPDLGKEIGANLGSQIGTKIETSLTSLPGLGGLFSHILG